MVVLNEIPPFIGWGVGGWGEKMSESGIKIKFYKFIKFCKFYFINFIYKFIYLFILRYLYQDIYKMKYIRIIGF